MVLTQFNEGLNYEVQDTESGVYCVTRIGLKEGQEVYPRIVRQLESGEWICSCNMPVYLGIPCRHICCVMVKCQVKIPKESVHSRWWRDNFQPVIHLRNTSPFLSKPGVARGLG